MCENHQKQQKEAPSYFELETLNLINQFLTHVICSVLLDTTALIILIDGPRALPPGRQLFVEAWVPITAEQITCVGNWLIKFV